MKSDRIILAIILTLFGVLWTMLAKIFSEYKPPWMQRAFGSDVGPMTRMIGLVVYTIAGVGITASGLALLAYTLANP